MVSRCIGYGRCWTCRCCCTVWGACFAAVVAYFPVAVFGLILIPGFLPLWTYFDATDPTVPKQRWLVMAPRRDSCEAARLANATRNCGDHCDIVFVGDSITESMIGQQCIYGVTQPDLHAPFHEAVASRWPALVLASGGDQTQHTLHQLRVCLPALRSPATRAFFVMVGTNNAGPVGGFGAEATAEGVWAVYTQIRSYHPSARVLLHPILPRADFGTPKGIMDTIDGANRILQARARAATDPGLQYVDCLAAFPRPDSAESAAELRGLMPDLLHPNADGYRKWFSCLRPELESAVEAR